MGFATSRIVINHNEQACYFHNMSQGGASGSMNFSAATLLHHLSGISDSNEKVWIYNENKEFFDQSYRAGIIDGDLNVNAIIREAPKGPHLKLLQIETLLRCNLYCSYCYCEAGKERPEALSSLQLGEILSDADRLGVLDVDFTGGEFFLRSDWKELIQEARRRCFHTSIHTNGMALTERNVAFLAEHAVKKIQISADGMDAETHNSVRGHPASFQMLLTGMKRAQEVGIPVVVNLMIHNKNVDQVRDAYRFYSDLGASIIVDWIAPFGSAQKEGLGIELQTYVNALLKVPELRSLVEASRPCGRDLGMSHNDIEPYCGVGQSYLFVTATGEMAICPTLTSREDSKAFNGPLLSDISLYEGWLSHPYFDRYRFVNCRNVSTCVAGTECRGGCRATAYIASGGDVSSPDIIECNVNKNATMNYVDFAERYAKGDFGIAY
ncbi:radical SAM protein with 4Fe4S-binding SPASM domain [Rhizobium sp. PP-F2F-G20b]|nr:radical SAM protein with 4Fe4S-binding SPASM domain [Rhizobium sp. PP-F2F-G20b]